MLAPNLHLRGGSGKLHERGERPVAWLPVLPPSGGARWHGVRHWGADAHGGVVALRPSRRAESGPVAVKSEVW